jgi:hypothetical protein
MSDGAAHAKAGKAATANRDAIERRMMTGWLGILTIVKSNSGKTSQLMMDNQRGIYTAWRLWFLVHMAYWMQKVCQRSPALPTATDLTYGRGTRLFMHSSFNGASASDSKMPMEYRAGQAAECRQMKLKSTQPTPLLMASRGS